VIGHGHVRTNGRKTNVPSYLVRVGDKITIKDSERSTKLVRAYLEELGEPQLQNWLRLDVSKLEGEVIALPTSEDVMIPVEEQMIVELCSQ
jgi:small subunit ribosomal protein S4